MSAENNFSSSNPVTGVKNSWIWKTSAVENFIFHCILRIGIDQLEIVNFCPDKQSHAKQSEIVKCSQKKLSRQHSPE